MKKTIDALVVLSFLFLLISFISGFYKPSDFFVGFMIGYIMIENLLKLLD